MFTRLTHKHLEIILIIAIVLLAAVLRFGQLDSAEFVWDQSHISLRAVDMARTGQIVWSGVGSSVDADAFMTLTWLLSIPYALSLDPLVATGFIALLNTLSVAAGYVLVRRWLGPLGALSAMLLYAVSPWAIEYSRKIWAGDPMPLFTVLYVATGWLAFVRGKRWALIAHALLAAWIAQLHFSGLPVILISAVWLLAFHKRLDWRTLGVAALLAALTFAPYFIVDAQQDWRNLNAFRALTTRPSTLDLESLDKAWRTSNGIDFASLAGPELSSQLEAMSPNARFLFPLEGVLIGLGLIVAVGIVLRRQPWSREGFDDEAAAAFMLATWLLIPILFHVRHVSGIAPTYFVIIYPVQYILIGLLVLQATRRGRIWEFALLSLIAVIAFAQVIEVRAVYGFVAENHTRGGYGTSIKLLRQAGETARVLSAEMDGAEIIVLGEGDDPRRYEFPRAADLLFYEQAHRSVDVFTTLVLPAKAAVFLAPSGRGNGARLLETLTPELYNLRIRTRKGGGSPYRFYLWDGLARLPDGVQPLASAREWENGVSLLATYIDGEARGGGVLRWVLVWRINAGADTTKTYHWFNHLLAEDGSLIAQADGAAYQPFYWRAGDTVFTWFNIPLPDGVQPLAPRDYVMRLGMYEYPALINVPLLDGSGEWTFIEGVQINRE